MRVLRTNADFDRIVATKHAGKIQRIGSYVKSSISIDVRCLLCDRRWGIKTGDLRRGRGCTSCNRKGPRISHEDFLSKVRAKHGDAVEVLGTFDGMVNRILCRCTICRHEWRPIADNLRSKSGCPTCNLTGFHRGRRASLYCFRVHHDIAGTLYKIGITNRDPVDRYKPADLSRMSLAMVMCLTSGEVAQDIERSIKRRYAAFRFPEKKTGFSFSNTELFTIDIFGVGPSLRGLAI